MTAAPRHWPAERGWIEVPGARPDGLRLRRLQPVSDAAVLQQWFGSEHGRFWAMPDKSAAGICAYYTRLQRSGHACAFLGHAEDCPVFVIECYDPAHDRLAAHYQVEPGDLGLHLFVAPPVIRVPHFTRSAMHLALTFMFQRLDARRVVVEPDVDNLRIHTLNHRMGFRDAGCIALPDKIATLAFCTHADFLSSQPPEHLP